MCFFEYWGFDGRNGLEIGEDWKWRASEGEVVWYDIHVAQRSLTTHNTLSSRATVPSCPSFRCAATVLYPLDLMRLEMNSRSPNFIQR